MTASHTDVQRDVARIALAGVERAGFALAGSGALREHGVTNRPTEDVDLFTSSLDLGVFEHAVDRVVSDLRAAGFQVEESRRIPRYARLSLRTDDGLELDVDMGVDWREQDPVTLDLDAIRADARFTDDELVAAAAERDAGFDVTMFAQQLDAVQRLQPSQVARYGVDPEQLEVIKARCVRWAARLRGEPPLSAPIVTTTGPA